MSFESFQLVSSAKKAGSTISALLVSVVDPPSPASENRCRASPSAPVDSQANALPGESSVMVLCSRCVPNCFAVVENVLPTATGAPRSTSSPGGHCPALCVSREIGDVVVHLTGRRVDRDPILVTLHDVPLSWPRSDVGG